MRRTNKKPGYHITTIPKGVVGESSKILEEVLELQDAELQNASVMALVELSDMIGAVELYLDRHHPSVTLEDLIIMSRITQRAFRNGYRS
jgi:hypothetical protein